MSFLWTFGGSRIDLQDPKPEQFPIEVIAHALSQICRWGGHCRPFFSVAHHSVLVSWAVEPRNALVGLLHDAAEVTCAGDVVGPFKGVLGAEYARCDEAAACAIGWRYGVDLLRLPANVHEVDKAFPVPEARVLLAVPEAELRAHFGARYTPPGGRLETLVRQAADWSPEEAEFMFLERFRDLGCQ